MLSTRHNYSHHYSTAALFSNYANFNIVPFLLPVFSLVRGHSALTMDTARATLAPFFLSDAVRSFGGNGDVVFVKNGEQFSASFDILKRGSVFSAQLYGPLGMTYAWIRAITAMRCCFTGDSQYTQNPSQHIRVGQGFLEYPLTWEEMLAAITLRYPCVADLRNWPDSMFTEKKTTRLLWKAHRFINRITDISVSLDNKTDRLSEIAYNVDEKGGWQLVFSDFLDGHAKEIRFVSSDSNYFYVKYHALTVNSRKALSP